MKKDVVINIRPFNIESITDSNGNFVLIFTSDIKGSYSKRKIVKVHLQFWWVKFIAKQLHKAINSRKSYTIEVENSLINDD